MNYETIKLLCKDGNPEDTITVKIKDLKLIIQEIKSEKFRLTTFEELENDRYQKNFRLYCEFLENELTNESLMLLKSTNLHDLVKYYNKDHCSIRLLNCLKYTQNLEENNIVAYNDLWNAIVNRNKYSHFGKKSFNELKEMILGVFKDKSINEGIFRFSQILNFVLNTRE